MPIELVSSWMVLIMLFVTHGLSYKSRNALFLFWMLVQVVLFKSTYSLLFSIGLLLCLWQLHSARFKQIFSNTFVKILFLIAGLYFASYPFMEYKDSLSNSMYRPISFFESDFVNYLIGNTLLFCVVLHSSRIKKIFSNKIFLFFGDISFMVYLTHFLLLFSFAPVLYAALLPSVSLTANLVITFTATLGLTIIVSFMMYRLVDKPCLRYCNWYAKKLFGL